MVARSPHLAARRRPPPSGPNPGLRLALLVAVTLVLISLVASVVVAVAVSAAGGVRLTAAEQLIAAVADIGLTLLVVGALAPLLDERVTRARLGLVRVRPLPALAAGLPAVVAFAGLLVVVALVGHHGAHLTLPPELSQEDPVLRAAGLGDATRVGFGPGLLASALARAVVAPAGAVALLAGLGLPALARWLGVPRAVGLFALLGASAALGHGADGLLLVPAIALGALIAWLRVRTATVLGSIAVACGAEGVLLGAQARLGAGASVGLGLACATVALGAGLLVAVAPEDEGRR